MKNLVAFCWGYIYSNNYHGRDNAAIYGLRAKEGKHLKNL
jgi:hypothetical protein